MNKADIHISLSENIRLRSLTAQDVNDVYVEALNNPERVKYMVSVAKGISVSEIVKYVNDNDRDQRSILFGIFDEDRFLGTCRLHDINQEQKSAHLGIFLFEALEQYKGLGTEVIKSVCGFAFSGLTLEKIYAGIFIDNIPSQKAFTKAGFSILEQSNYHGRIYQMWIKSAV
ncbi:MAG: GNAT family N-acetyltransferase [Micavibrio sp.]